MNDDFSIYFDLLDDEIFAPEATDLTEKWKIGQKAVWFMLHWLRMAFEEDPD